MIKLYLNIIVLCSSLTCFCQDYYERGKTLYNDGSNDSLAIELFSLSIDSGSRVSESLLMRGALKYYLNDYFGALEDILASEVLDSTDSDLYYFKGNIYLELDSMGKAFDAFRYAKILNPDDPMIFNSIGIFFMKSGKYDDAIENFNYAIKLDSTKGDYFNNRGYSQMMQGKYDSSLNDYNISIALGDKNAIGNKGILLAHMMNYEEALLCFSEAIDQQPNLPEFKYQRALVYIILEQESLACKDLMECMELGYESSVELLKEYCWK